MKEIRDENILPALFEIFRLRLNSTKNLNCGKIRIDVINTRVVSKIYQCFNMVITDERSRSILYAAPPHVSAKFTTTIFTRHGWPANPVVSVDAIAERSSATAVRPFRQTRNLAHFIRCSVDIDDFRLAIPVGFRRSYIR